MESITALEKLKNPVVALLGGIVAGASLTWTAVTNLHEERVKIFETAKAELEHQVAIRDKALEQKDAELKALSSKLAALPNSALMSAHSATELRKLIAQLDAEIEKKKAELRRHGGISAVRFEDGWKESPKSDSYLQIEQEIQTLNEQRNLARKRLIDGMSK
jgi:uncharacterized small protein (DUF1192 family)